MLELFDYVGVGVHRDTYLGVSQNLHDDARMDALRQEQRRARMAQIMEAPERQTSVPYGLPEVARQVPGVHRRANGRGKDQPMVLPTRARQKPFLKLSSAMEPHSVYDDLGQCYCPPALLRFGLESTTRPHQCSPLFPGYLALKAGLCGRRECYRGLEILDPSQFLFKLLSSGS